MRREYYGHRSHSHHSSHVPDRYSGTTPAVAFRTAALIWAARGACDSLLTNLVPGGYVFEGAPINVMLDHE